jgi:hypothetical protein
MAGVTKQEIAITRRSIQRAQAQRDIDAELEDLRINFSERAAICEYEGNLPRAEAERIAREENDTAVRRKTGEPQGALPWEKWRARTAAPVPLPSPPKMRTRYCCFHCGFVSAHKAAHAGLEGNSSCESSNDPAGWSQFEEEYADDR